MPYQRSSNTVSFSVATPSLKVVSVSSNIVSPGDTLQVTVQYTMDGSAVSGRTVNLQLNVGGAWQGVASATTGSDGKATISWSVGWYVAGVKLPCGRYSARVIDLYYGVSSDTFTIAVAYPTRIENPRTDKSVYAPGSTIYVYADLKYLDADGSWKPLANQTLTFRLRDSAGNIIESKTGTTDSNGTAMASFTAPSASGSYSFLIEYMGYGLGLPAFVSLAGVQVSVPEAIAVAVSMVPLIVSSIVLVATMAAVK
jgi:uncharacterized protein YfaS (alpha-2-macroglobulin family)